MNDWIVKIFTCFTIVIGVIAMAAGLGLLIAFPLKWCWNYAMPHIFHLPAITWGQAWCLYFVCNCLIKTSSSSNSK
jgi:hypothetical protein